MKHGQTTTESPLLAFGAHPDDIEFSCGGVVARETQSGRPAHHGHLLACGEAASNGTTEIRRVETENAAAILGATHELLLLDGDAKLEIAAPAHTLKIARIIRRIRPQTLSRPKPGRKSASRSRAWAQSCAMYRALVPLRRPGRSPRCPAPHAQSILFSTTPLRSTPQPTNCTRIFFWCRRPPSS